MIKPKKKEIKADDSSNELLNSNHCINVDVSVQKLKEKITAMNKSIEFVNNDNEIVGQYVTKRFELYNKDYIAQKKENINRYITDKEKNKKIIDIISSASLSLNQLNELAKNGIDFYLDIALPEDEEIVYEEKTFYEKHKFFVILIGFFSLTVTCLLLAGAVLPILTI